MDQPGFRHLRIAPLSHGDVLLLGCAVGQMLVAISVLTGGQKGNLLLTRTARVVVARPDLDVIGHGEEFLRGLVELLCTAAWEIAARGANVRVEDGVSAKDVVKHALALVPRYIVFARECFLDLCDALADANARRPILLLASEAPLEVGRSREVVCVDMGFKDPLDLVVVGLDETQNGVGVVCCDFLRGRVKVEHRVDHGSLPSGGIGHEILPGAGALVKDAVD